MIKIQIFYNNLYELKEVLTDNGISKEIANKIVIFTILIKYLEEREDEDKNTVFPENLSLDFRIAFFPPYKD